MDPPQAVISCLDRVHFTAGAWTSARGDHPMSIAGKWVAPHLQVWDWRQFSVLRPDQELNTLLHFGIITNWPQHLLTVLPGLMSLGPRASRDLAPLEVFRSPRQLHRL